jgi:hypothetical protein
MDNKSEFMEILGSSKKEREIKRHPSEEERRRNMKSCLALMLRLRAKAE